MILDILNFLGEIYATIINTACNVFIQILHNIPSIMTAVKVMQKVDRSIDRVMSHVCNGNTKVLSTVNRLPCGNRLPVVCLDFQRSEERAE